jgi:hypothetical protein
MSNPLYIATGSFTAASSAAAVNVNCGFVPDYVKLINVAATARQIATVEWFRGSMGEAAYLKETIVVDSGSTGDKSLEYVSSSGLTKLDTYVAKPTCWKPATAYAVGDIVHPTTLNGYYYKCSVAGTSNATYALEPTWGTTVGGNTTETITIYWVCYKETDLPVMRTPLKGFTVPAALQINSTVCHWLAMRNTKEAVTQ